jgi:hypothetical protein
MINWYVERVMCTKLDIYVFIVSYHHYKILFTLRLKMFKISNLEDTNILQSMLKLKTHSGFHDLFLK